MQKVIIIPARMQSKRFPGKVLHPINSVPMIIRTWRQAMKVPDCSVYIASDDDALLKICQDYPCQTIKIGEHRNGTERCAEAARRLGLERLDCVLNLQADLPCIDPELLARVIDLIPYYIMTAATITEGLPSLDTNLVKIAIDKDNDAVFFSRAAILNKAPGWYNHIGIYGYMNFLLQEYAIKPISLLEQYEDLEQLRFYDYGRQMKVFITDKDCISINVPSDLEKLNIQWPDEQVIGHVI